MLDYIDKHMVFLKNTYPDVLTSLNEKELIKSNGKIFRTKISDEYVGRLYSLIKDNIKDEENPNPTGQGLRLNKTLKTPKFSGKGKIREHLPSKNKLYTLDVDNLKKGVLSVKYANQRNYKIPNTNLSKDAVDLIELTARGNFNKRLYNLLNDEERIVFENFLKVFGIDNIANLDGETATEKLYHEFQILRAEIQAGNNNPDLRKKLRGIVLQLINNRRIPKSTGFNILI
jgi:hypothetical protein